MEKLQILVNNEQESEEAQNLLVDIGYKKKIFVNNGFPRYVTTDFDSGSYVSTGRDVAVDTHKTITLPELRQLAGNKSLNDQYAEIEGVRKEYLDSAKNYMYVQDTVKRSEDWIEIPDGANFYCDKYFWKQLDSYEFWNGNNWQGDEKTLSEFMERFGCVVSWSRFTQTEELPFVDDEPKLEDIELNLTGIDATLAERQSTYGSFQNVANTTGALMAVIKNSKNGQTMPYSHDEALHMICSKIARIVNGDCNHKDSWHDIAGYAKLIEDLL